MGLGRDPDPIGDIGEFQLGKKVEQGRLVKSHRVIVSFCEELRTALTDHRTMAHHVDDATLTRQELHHPSGRDRGSHRHPRDLDQE